MNVGILPVGTVLVDPATKDRWIVTDHFAYTRGGEELSNDLTFIPIAYTMKKQPRLQEERLRSSGRRGARS